MGLTKIHKAAAKFENQIDVVHYINKLGEKKITGCRQITFLIKIFVNVFDKELTWKIYEEFLKVYLKKIRY